MPQTKRSRNEIKKMVHEQVWSVGKEWTEEEPYRMINKQPNKQTGQKKKQEKFIMYGQTAYWLYQAVRRTYGDLSMRHTTNDLSSFITSFRHNFHNFSSSVKRWCALFFWMNGFGGIPTVRERVQWPIRYKIILQIFATCIHISHMRLQPTIVQYETIQRDWTISLTNRPAKLWTRKHCHNINAGNWA